MQGDYALIQYSPAPERMEFLNIGVMLMIPEVGFMGVRMAAENARIDRFFGVAPRAYLRDLKAGVESRLRIAFAEGGPEGVAAFAARRANDVRLSDFMPVAADEPEVALAKLFVALVGDAQAPARRPRAATLLRDAFIKAQVLELLDEKPDPEPLPGVGAELRPAYGYQNGAYNLVDPMRLQADPKAALKEVGLRGIEGNLLAQHSSGAKRLVVVADMGNHSRQFFDMAAEQIKRNEARLYRLDDLGGLIDDIKRQADLHNRPAGT
jgi:hypothetical protein